MARDMTVLCVVGARPNFMKIGPIIDALTAAGIRAPLVHTGQHYDAEMNDRFFDDLGLPHPDVNLDVGSGSHAVQTAEIMIRFEAVLDRFAPDAVLVVGDVNSTIACALVATKKGIRVIHVEAGLRSFDRAMPEEVNRVLTDQISDLLFVTERAGLANLAREGIAAEHTFLVGNVMIDTLLRNLKRAVAAAELLAGTAATSGGYALVTLHRPSNVDEPAVLEGLLRCLRDLSEHLPVVFPLHPRTRARIEAEGLSALLDGPALVCRRPAGYLEMLGLIKGARIVLTDSGGLQEETTALGIPCLTLRPSTERPITIDEGTNTLVGSDPAVIAAAVEEVLTTGGKGGRIPELWDGHAAERIAAIVVERLRA